MQPNGGEILLGDDRRDKRSHNEIAEHGFHICNFVLCITQACMIIKPIFSYHVTLNWGDSAWNIIGPFVHMDFTMQAQSKIMIDFAQRGIVQ